MERSRQIKRLTEIREEEEKVERAGGAGAEARKTNLRLEREQLERSLAPRESVKPKVKPEAEKKQKQEVEVADLDDMPPLEGELKAEEGRSRRR